MSLISPEQVKLISLQAAVTAVGVILSYIFISPLAAKSFGYGSCIVLMSTLFMVWRFKQGESNAEISAEWALRQAYRTEIERFLWTAMMMAAGFKMLKLEPIWMLAGFIGGQVAWLLIPIWMNLRTQNDN
jgi:F0F1-type ATP synthase assembly protein I